MPNLKEWTEEQLKRGYSKDQIKNHLTGKGYPPKIVAQVDQFDIAKSTKPKTITLKISLKYIFITLTVILLLVVVLNYFLDGEIIEVKKDTQNEQNYIIYSGNYVGSNNRTTILENGGKEFSVTNEDPNKNFQIYMRLKNGDEVLIEKKEPEIGTPLIYYMVLENNKQKLKKIVINYQEDLT